MKSEKKMEIIDTMKGNNLESRNYAQQFLFPNCSVTHQNLLQVSKRETKAQALTIDNFFAVISDDKVVKVTEIHLEDKIIRIIDSYISNQHTQNVEASEFKCQEIVPEEFTQNKQGIKKDRQKCFTSEREACRNRDGKNVVKNVFKIFQNWIYKHTKPQQQLDSILEETLGENGKKFNNNLIKRIMRDPQLRSVFQVFSETEGEELIWKSRINDKKTHVQALKSYRSMCQSSREDLEEINEISGGEGSKVQAH